MHPDTDSILDDPEMTVGDGVNTYKKTLINHIIACFPLGPSAFLVDSPFPCNNIWMNLAINHYNAHLLDYGKQTSQYNLTEALLFLSHFMGDIHQDSLRIEVGTRLMFIGSQENQNFIMFGMTHN
ncbi:unnamed protein product [Lactuca virosa]|uniref:Aspergillus nuclease S(1) n=1 Tax=Lactuca virosa TaxID=75947 RepID=A0AAU9LFY6_9ASTR|nr:unnamed protein product [Lactuca virosa]